ncbi:helix-turn-helix transcriptional regulator [Arthrobacter citreus]|nr:helix-turn-helix transcriptional regulator [Arthrobacter citreus]
MKCNLEKIILKKGFKKGFIAKEIGVTPQHFSKWIKGELYPPADKLFRLAKLLSCTVDEMYTDEE